MNRLRGCAAIALAVAMAAPAAEAQEVRAQLNGATALVGGRPEVRLRARMELGWIPPEGVRIYRVAGGRRELLAQRAVSDAAADRALDASLRGKGLWSKAAARTTVSRPLDFAVLRPPSAAARFRQLKAAGDALIAARERPDTDAGRRTAIQQGLGLLATASAVAPARLAPTATLRPSLGGLTASDRDVVAARGRLSLSALVKANAAESLGLGARDRNVRAGDRIRYEFALAPARGVPERVLDSVVVVVGADPQPPAPADVESQQLLDEDGEPSGTVGLRWARLAPTLEATLLNASYLIERRHAPPSRTTFGLRTGTAPTLGTRVAAAEDTVWRSANAKPVMIAAINGDEEPLSFFEDDLDAPGRYEYRIALVDGFGRRSPWTEHELRVVEWRRPPAPGAPSAELDEEPRDAAGNPIPRTRLTPVLGFGRLTARPKDLSSWAAAPYTLAGRASVKVSWTAVSAPSGLTSRYRIFRVDLEAANPQPVLVTPQPIEGTALPPTPEQDSARVQAAALERSMATGSALRAAPPALRSQMLDRMAQIVRLRDLARPRLGFTDAGVPTDRRYEYLVRAVYAPSGLESEDAAGAVIGVPTPVPPPAVSGGAFAGFTPTERLAAGQVLADSAGQSHTRAFTAARRGLPRLAKAPAGFRRASATVRSFASVKSLRLGAARSAPTGVTPSPATGIATGALAGAAPTTVAPSRIAPLAGGLDVARPTIVPRDPVFARADLAKLRLNLLHARDDGGVAALRWNPITQLKGVTYKIQRKYGNLDWVDVGTTAAGQGTFRDVLPRSMARTYSYRVIPISRWGVAGPAAAAFPAAVPSTVRPGTPNLLAVAPDRGADRALRVRIDPNPADESVTSYRVLRDGTVAGTVTAGAGTGGELAFVDPDRTAGRRYEYQVVAVTAAGLESAPSRKLAAVAVRLAAAAPSELVATAEAGGVRLTWSAAVDAASYCVRRRAGAGALPHILAGSVRGALTYLDASAMPGNTYQYEVLATDAFGNVSPAAAAGVILP